MNTHTAANQKPEVRLKVKDQMTSFLQCTGTHTESFTIKGGTFVYCAGGRTHNSHVITANSEENKVDSVRYYRLKEDSGAGRLKG